MSSESSPYRAPALNTFDKKIALPSSKSHANRALIMGAIKGGNFTVHNISAATDVTNLVAAFKKIGLKIKAVGDSLIFENSFPSCEKDSEGEVIELQTGDGGTTNRFLIALLSRGKKEYHLYPSEKMRERPIVELVEPLKKLGVKIFHNTQSSEHVPWVSVQGPALINKGSKIEIDCQKSTQFATALMLAFSDFPLQFEFQNLNASETYLKMTSEVIKKSLENNSFTIPVDFSSLSYPVALAALMGRVLITNCTEIDSYQADAVFLELLKNSGAIVTLSDQGLEVKKGSDLRPVSFNVSKAPDLFPTLVFLAAHIEGESTFSNLQVLQFKESDRLMQMMSLLKSFEVGFDYDATESVLKVIGKSGVRYPRAMIRPARDHRIVMGAALFMMKNSGGELFEVDCVEKSFPGFFKLLLDLGLH